MRLYWLPTDHGGQMYSAEVPDDIGPHLDIGLPCPACPRTDGVPGIRSIDFHRNVYTCSNAERHPFPASFYRDRLAFPARTPWIESYSNGAVRTYEMVPFIDDEAEGHE